MFNLIKIIKGSKKLKIMGNGKIDTGLLLFLLSLIILVITVAMPLLMIAYNTFFYKFSFDWSLFIKMVFNQGNFKAILNTIKIAGIVTVIGTIVGIFFSWLIGRSDMPFKESMKSLFIIPYMFPPFIGAMAWELLLAPRAGYLNKLFMGITGGTAPLFNINSIAGIAFVEICYYFPFVFLQVSSALERMDPTLEESARIAGANQFFVIRKITLPLTIPAIGAGALLMLISSLSHFGVPAILGWSVNIFTLPTRIYEVIYKSGGSFEGIRQGSALSVLLVGAVVIAILIQKRVLRSGHFEIIRGKSMRPMLIKLRKFKYPFLAVCFLFLAITVLLPLFIIFAVGSLKAYGLPLLFKNFTMDNFINVLFHSKLAQDAMKNSMFLSISAAIITMFVGTMIAYVVIKVKPKGKMILEALATLPYSIPGIVLAIGVILVWSGKFCLNLYNTLWIILIAYIARYMTFSMKSASASLEQVHDSLEEASRISGATHWGSLADITIPLIKPGMIAGFLLIFLPAMRELTTSLLLYGPFTRTMGVAIYSIHEDGNTVESSALACVAIVIITIGLIILRIITRERKGK